MNIEKILKGYKLKKTLLETSLNRIEAYEYIVQHPEVGENYYTESNMDSAMSETNSKKESIIEKIFDRREMTNERIKKLIDKEKGRIFLTQLEVEQIDKVLMAIGEEERFIIECKYFDNMFWRDIEIKFNDAFREDNYITVAGLRKINSKTLKKIETIIQPFYDEEFLFYQKRDS